MFILSSVYVLFVCVLDLQLTLERGCILTIKQAMDWFLFASKKQCVQMESTSNAGVLFNNEQKMSENWDVNCAFLSCDSVCG